MGTDCVFRMGAQHRVCQDYALTGARNGGLEYAILSDGCSGVGDELDSGAPYTDIGARLLVWSTLRRIHTLQIAYCPALEIIGDAWETCRSMRLPALSLDATLLMALGSPHGVIVHQTGDGVVAARHRDGAIHWRRLRFTAGMPYYLNYWLDAGRCARYFDEAGDLIVQYGGSESSEDVMPVAGAPCIHPASYPRELFDLVLLFSDGVESFVDRQNQPVPLDAVLSEAFAIKNFKGEFLTRRCQRFLGKTCQERGWRHLDDFSVAGIYMGDTGA